MATTKTFYPSFRARVKNLNLYVGRRGVAMTAALGIGGTQFQTDLTALQDALNKVLTTWPDYTETP